MPGSDMISLDLKIEGMNSGTSGAIDNFETQTVL